MAQQLTLGRPVGQSPRLVRVARQRVRSLLRDLLHPYRPELHYMRGPGPAWRAKHDGVAAKG
jgi:hypothetical protein